VTASIFEVYNLAMGIIAGIGLVYLLYLERVVVGYRRFLVVVTVGVLTFSVAAPVAEIVAPAWVHVVHGISALFVISGLYEPVQRNLRTDGSLTTLVKEPTSMRLPPGWMTPMDDDILELFHSAHLVLTPAIIAYNLDYSREEVNRRLSKLEDHDIVTRVERGKYRITGLGERYLQGRLPVERDGVEPEDPTTEGNPST